VGTITINVLGKEYSIKSDVEAESLNQIAGYLNGKVDQIIKSTKTVSTHNILILAAMSIANDYFEVKSTHESLIDMVEGKSEHLASRIASQT
jgi:cell division protein ZapA